MASTILQQENPSVATETETKSQKKQKKLRKKNARRIAKIKLQLGQAQKSVQRAEQKVSRAQSKLEVRKDQVQTLEEKLTRLHSEQPAATSGSEPDEQTTLSPSDTSSYDENGDAISETNLSSLLPAEGPDDIPLGVQDLESMIIEGAYQSPLSHTVGPVESSNLPDEDAEASMETNLSSLPPVEGRDDITDIQMDTESQHPAEGEEPHPEENGRSSSTSRSRSRRRSHS